MLVVFYAAVVALFVHIGWKVTHRRPGESVVDAIQRLTVTSGILYALMVISFLDLLRTDGF